MSEEKKGVKKEDTTLSDTERAAYEKKVSEMERAVRDMKKESLKAAINGKVPADKIPLVMELADNLPVEDSIELSDDTGSKKKVSAIDLLTEIFKAIPLPVRVGEMEMGDADKGKEINYASLVRHV